MNNFLSKHGDSCVTSRVARKKKERKVGTKETNFNNSDLICVSIRGNTFIYSTKTRFLLLFSEMLRGTVNLCR